MYIMRERERERERGKNSAKSDMGHEADVG
jgi:hypothetical protein